MPIVQPFRALRPPPELAHRVAAPPYDVLDVPQARAAAAGQPDSFLHVSRPEIDLPPEVDPHAPEVYRQGRTNLEDFLGRGVLRPDADAHLYVYRQRLGHVTQTGVVACFGVDDYESGLIKRHELTRPDKETDRVCHIDVLDAHDEPVFLLARRSDDVERLIGVVTGADPDYDFVASDDVAHTFWVVRDQATGAELAAALAALPRLYLADGHHRAAAAARVRDLRRRANPENTGQEDYNVFPGVVFGDDQLTILGYHRAVTDLGGLSPAGLLEAISPVFEVAASPGPVSPQHRGHFGMYADGRWHALRVRPGLVDDTDVVARLDVSVLQDRLLAPVLGIADPRTDGRLRFVGGLRGVEELARSVDSGGCAVAFSLHPVSANDLLELADRDEVMPPKSTWFEPKLRSGLFVHPLR